MKKNHVREWQKSRQKAKLVDLNDRSALSCPVLEFALVQISWSRDESQDFHFPLVCVYVYNGLYEYWVHGYYKYPPVLSRLPRYMYVNISARKTTNSTQTELEWWWNQWYKQQGESFTPFERAAGVVHATTRSRLICNVCCWWSAVNTGALTRSLIAQLTCKISQVQLTLHGKTRRSLSFHSGLWHQWAEALYIPWCNLYLTSFARIILSSWFCFIV